MGKIVFIFMVIMFLNNCTLLKKKHKIIISPEQVSSAIVVDDNYLLNKYLSDGFPVDYNFNGNTLLERVLENNSLKSLKTLLNRGVDIEQRDEYGKTPIFYVRSLEALQMLIDDGAEIDVYDKNNESLLTFFIKNKPESYSELIINKGVKIDDWNTLFWASVEGTPQIISHMAKNGADFSTKNKNGNYPIYYSYNENNILELLKVGNYNLSEVNLKNENILGEVYLRAVANGYIKVVDKLIEMGVNPRYMSYGDNALSIANDTENEDMINYLKSKGLK